MLQYKAILFIESLGVIRMFVKRLRLLILVAVFLFMPSAVYAHEGEEHSDSTQTEVNQVEKEQAIKDRIDKRKAELKTALTRNAETRLKARCESAQVLIQKVHSRSDEAKKRRINAYNNLLSRITNLVEKLKAANVDTIAIETIQTDLALKVQELLTTIDNYHQAIDDTSLVNCTDDPLGFKASLDGSRQLQQDLKPLHEEIRTMIRDTLIPAIHAVKTQVKE